MPALPRAPVLYIVRCIAHRTLPGGVGELHLVTVDRVAQQLGVHTGHPPLDVELADKPANGRVRTWINFHCDELKFMGRKRDRNQHCLLECGGRDRLE